MARQKEFRGPTSFCEWVVGTNIPSALGPGKKPRRIKPHNRDVIKVELTTDEETEEDSLKITYPRRRSRGKKAAVVQDLQLKKVRFDESPKKSALKKTKTYVVAESSDDDDKTSDSADASTDSARSRIILIPEKDLKLHTVKLVDDSKSQDSSEPDSEADSDPDPTCKCIDCIRGRQKLVRRKRRASLMKQILSSRDDLSDGETETENETDDSDEGGKKEDKKKDKKKDTGTDGGKDRAKDQKQDKKKQAAKNAAVETESGSESGAVTDDADNENSESDAKSKGKKQKNKQQKSEEEGKCGNDKSKKESENKSSKKEEPESKKKKKNEPKKKDESKEDKSTKSKSYPEATPGPNPRRPNLIGPIRAEVVQTERVIETQEDPPPNAYYDHENNVLRVYHGPVYGGFHNRGLYPKRDAARRSLPLGTSHPLQNPYFHGFTHAPPQPLPGGQENLPVSQWPSNAWPTMPWPGLPPHAQQNVAPGPAPAPAPAEGGSKGAFSDRAGRNNVGPVDNGMPNPYYSKQTSPFRSYGKGRTASPFAGMGSGNKNGSPKVSASGWNNDGAGGSVGKGSQNGNGWGAKGVDEAQNQASGGWGNQEAQGHNTEWNNDQYADQAQHVQDWGNGDATQNEQGTWANGQAEEQPAEQTKSWGVANDTGAGEADGQSNVMPGSWGGPPTWGDPTMAADTKGAVDQAGGEPSW
ncbi:hypothetical protein LIA77_10272 [Sarocladium implicatum]|nr:hypothetical protein LIA77_10272 [Sarocladium implicatum]